MTQPTSTEIEAKYRIVDKRLVSRLQKRKTLTRRFQLGAAEESNVVDVYMDTEDIRLLRLGFILRLRQKNGKRMVTLKGLHSTRAPDVDELAAVHRRYELEQILEKNSQIPWAAIDLKPTALPDQIGAAISQIAGKKSKLSPILTIKQTRSERLITAKTTAGQQRSNGTVTDSIADSEDDSRRQVAALSVDEVFVFRGAEFGEESKDALYAFGEVEAELLPGRSIEGLAPIVRFLSDFDGLEPVRESKFERAFVAVSRSLPDKRNQRAHADSWGIQTTMPITEAMRLVWREQFSFMLLQEAGVRRDDDTEYVHQMRVAIRRMRSAFMLFGHFFSGNTIGPLMKNLKQTARLLGRVRDMDVALAKLARYSERLDLAAQKELHPLSEHWKQQRARCFPELISWFDSKKYRRFLVSLADYCTTPGKGVKSRYASLHQPPEAIQVRHVLPAMLLERFLSVRKYEALFELDDSDNGNPIEIDTLHQLRIEAKYLRYGLEFSPELLGEEGQQLSDQLRKLQDLLGDLNDASVAKEMLLDLPKEMRTKAVKKYIKRQDKLLQKIEKRAQSRVSAFLSSENRAILGTMLGRI